MSNYTNPDGRTFTIPNYSDFSNGPDNFKAFAATMPSYGSEIMTISAGDAAYEQKHLSRVLWFQSGGEYTLNDSAPVGAQVSVATSNGFVSIMTDGVSAEPAQERLIRPYSVVTCTKVASGMWLVAKGSGASGQYFNEATGGTITTYTVANETWIQHTFTSSGTFTLTAATQPIKVRLIGKGGNSGYADCPNAGGGQGGGGGGYEWQGVLSEGAHTVTVGTTPSSGGTHAQGSTVAGVGTAGGGGNGTRGFYGTDRGNGQAGTWGGTSNGTGGDGSRDGGSIGFRTLWDGQYNVWGQGAPGRSHSDCGANSAPANGVVAITYQIG